MSARAGKLRRYQNKCLESGFDQVFPKSLCEEEMRLFCLRLMAGASAVPEAGSGHALNYQVSFTGLCSQPVPCCRLFL